MRSRSISLDGYGCKIRKVSSCRPAVSSKTILTTRQEFFFTKLTGFLINAALLNVYFILHYHIFFAKEIYFNVYISLNTIFECLYMFFGWERGHQLRTYATVGGIKGAIQNAYSYERGGVTSNVYIRTYTISFHIFGSIFVLQCIILFVEI